MTDWRTGYKKQRWDESPAGGMQFTVGGIYANGSDATLKLTARADGDFVVVTLFIFGTKITERRSAIEDPMRAAELMAQVLDKLGSSVGDGKTACAPVAIRGQGIVRSGDEALKILRNRLERVADKDVFTSDKKVWSEEQRSYDEMVAARVAKARQSGEHVCEDCRDTIEGCECGNLRPPTSYG